jgi:hypothetical protein
VSRMSGFRVNSKPVALGHRTEIAQVPNAVRAVLLGLACGLLAACGAANAEAEPTALLAMEPGPHFSWTTIDGARITSDDLRGRASLVLFITMHELGSDLMAQQAEHCLHSVAPRTNVVAVLMQGPEFAPLATSFRDQLELSYPVVMADPAALRGTSPFGAIDYLPKTFVLDRNTQVKRAISGITTEAELERALHAAADD